MFYGRSVVSTQQQRHMPIMTAKWCVNTPRLSKSPKAEMEKSRRYLFWMHVQIIEGCQFKKDLYYSNSVNVQQWWTRELYVLIFYIHTHMCACVYLQFINKFTFVISLPNQYADGTVLMAYSEWKLKAIWDKVVKDSKKKELTVERQNGWPSANETAEILRKLHTKRKCIYN